MTTHAWTFDGYWTTVIGDMDAGAACAAFDLEAGDLRGFSEWLGEAERTAWIAGGLDGDMADAWGAHHDRAARMLQSAAAEHAREMAEDADTEGGAA